MALSDEQTPERARRWHEHVRTACAVISATATVLRVVAAQHLHWL